MKRIKKLFVGLIAMIMTCVCTFSLAGCVEDIKKLELNIQVYDYSTTNEMEDYTISIDLYRHLAPKTVDAIIEYVNDGYYNDAIFYKMDDYTKQIMVGDLLDKDGIEQNAIKPEIEGEFEAGGTIGSNLTNKKGALGLWRSWYEVDGDYDNNNNATATGRATWYIPTDTISTYNKYFCVFGQFDADANSEALTALNTAFGSGHYEEYVVFYTGEYDDQKADDNYGLTFNCLTKSEYDQRKDSLSVFEAEGAQLVSYNATTIRIPMANHTVGAKIVSAKIV